MSLSPEIMRAIFADPTGTLIDLDRELCERSLYTFLERSWPHFDPAPFCGGWHLEAICKHLEAVTRGQIRKLLINVPPRTSKTSATTIAWPAWTWALQQSGALAGPQVKFLCLSYSAKLTDT